MIKKILEFSKKRKKTSIVIIIVIVIIGFFAFRSGTKAETKYVLASVEKGTLIVSVSGSGQISASKQIELKSKSAGDITGISVKAGQEVKTGALIAKINNQDALKAVRDAQISLESSKIALEQANASQDSAEGDYNKAYESGFNTITETFSDLPDVMAGLKDALFSDALNGNGTWNIDVYGTATPNNYDPMYDHNASYQSYHKADSLYKKSSADYQLLSRSQKDLIVSELNETYETSKSISEALKNADSLIQEYKRYRIGQLLKVDPNIDTYLTNLESDITKMNKHVLDLYSAIETLKQGVDPLVLKTKQLNVRQSQNNLLDAQEKLADSYIRAPFGGVVAKINFEYGDSITSADSIATLITKQQVAEISLNEVDAAKIKVGQKATLTFDAIFGLSLTGTVSEIDSIGTASQGVVSYNTKIVLDAQDDRIKPGMSITASIITDSKQNVLLIPNSAIKSSGDSSYVEISNEKVSQTAMAAGVKLTSPLKEQPVETGLSNDSYTEVTSGLNEGDQVVIRTTSTAKQASSSLLNNRGGNAVRIGR